ncbi:hypothetical protein Tco_0985946 [Tanacetum coccineum]
MCSDASESDSKIPERHVSPTTSSLEISIGPILPAPSAIVTPSSDFHLHLCWPHPGIRQRRSYLIRTGEDIPIGRLYRTHPGGPCRALTARKSVRPLPYHRLALRYTLHHLDRFTSGSSSSHSSLDHSSSGHSIMGHSLSGHTSPDTTDVDFEAYLRWRSAPLSTMYPPTTSESSVGDYSSKDSITLEDSVEEDIDTDVLEDIEADAMADEVTVDRDVEDGVDASIGMEVDVGVDVEDEVEDEVESSDRGTIEVGVDVVAGIDIPDGMLMPDAVEHLEQVEEGLQDIYEHVIEIPL